MQLDLIFFPYALIFKNILEIGKFLQSNYSLTKVSCTKLCVVLTCQVGQFSVFTVKKTSEKVCTLSRAFQERFTILWKIVQNVFKAINTEFKNFLLFPTNQDISVFPTKTALKLIYTC